MRHQLFFLGLLMALLTVGCSGGGETVSAQTAFDTGNDLVQQGKLNEAVESYKQAIELDPNYQAAYVNLGVAYYQLEDFELAEAQYKKALEINPNDGEVAYNLGALYLQQALLKGEPFDQAAFDKAINQIEQAIDLLPNLAEPHFSLGVAYTALGRVESAINEFETFLASNPTDERAVVEAQRYLDGLRSQQ